MELDRRLSKPIVVAIVALRLSLRSSARTRSSAANWWSWPAKFAWARDVDDYTNLRTSLLDHWGFPSPRELTRYNKALTAPSGSIADADPGHDKACEWSLLLDFSYQEQVSDNWSGRVDPYNLLRWADVDFNNRKPINRVSDYRPEVAAVGVSVRADH